ncbi:DegT/DnrJ/EryC1/StrS family aminotransferase [Kiloniella sp.]|uniref:DegT/DnrJ/EryC1/StrS family aminotransferase n=1 Tax=Kiloniella sp. TaxID=1938587 RepID=UPI003A9357A6
MNKIPFIDLKTQRIHLKGSIEAAVEKVIEHGQYIMGPEVRQFELALERYTNAEHVISCANGTDALSLALMALDIQPNDVVFVPNFTFAATAEAVALLGAIPYFVDVNEETFLIDFASLESSIYDAKRNGHSIKGIIAVDLFGAIPDYDKLTSIAKENNLFVIADAAQSIGATYGNRQVGTLAEITTTSFFPSKPLGAYGDGGAVITNNTELADKIKSLRIHGKGIDKYDNVRVGMNSRLDTIQAAILLEKINILSDEIFARQKIASTYSAVLPESLIKQKIHSTSQPAWAQYTVHCTKREIIREKLINQGIPTAIYYPTPLNELKAYQTYPSAPEGLQNSRLLSSRVFSLPMSPYLTEADQNYICATIEKILKRQ